MDGKLSFYRNLGKHRAYLARIEVCPVAVMLTQLLNEVYSVIERSAKINSSIT